MKLHIAVLPGDGIGPEVVEQALNVTKAVCEKFGHSLEYQTAPVGACAIEETGLPYPDSTHELCMRSDAVLFGAIGSPQYDNNPMLPYALNKDYLPCGKSSDYSQIFVP